MTIARALWILYFFYPLVYRIISVHCLFVYNNNNNNTMDKEELGQAFNEAADEKNFSRQDHLVEVPEDTTPFKGRFDASVLVKKQDWVVAIVCTPSDAKPDVFNPKESVSDRVATQRADWLYVNFIGAFSSEDAAKKHAKLVHEKYPQFSVCYYKTGYFQDIPPRVDSTSETRDSELDAYLKKYFGARKQEKENHTKRIDSDMHRASEDQAKMRRRKELEAEMAGIEEASDKQATLLRMQAAERERLSAGGDPSDFTMDLLNEQFAALQKTLALSSSSSSSTPDNQATVASTDGFRFGTQLTNLKSEAMAQLSSANPMSTADDQNLAAFSDLTSATSASSSSLPPIPYETSSDGTRTVELPIKRGPDMSLAEFESHYGKEALQQLLGGQLQ